MAGNYTLTIIKPDAFGRNLAGRILAHLEEQGFRIRAARTLRMTEAQAKAFYEVHKDRPFYGSLVSFMTSGPCMPVILEKEDAVAALRKAIGATDPAEAEEGTGWRVEVAAEMTCGEAEFRVQEEYAALVDGEELFRGERSYVIPRDLV